MMVTLTVSLAALALGGAASYQAMAGHSSRTDTALYEGSALSGAAPEFTLTDQRGADVGLSDLRGRVVLLAFLDPNCTDICPLTALHFRQVSEEMGTEGAQVALLAVNANPEATSVDDVAAASRRWGVDSLPAWHFLTGDADELEAVRGAYGVLGGVPKADMPGEVAHTPGVFVIDQSGERRWYVSVPENAFLDQDWPGPPLTEVLLTHARQLLHE
ncbi:MAG: SCO family protein [Gemmatimonadota bacterium]